MPVPEFAGTWIRFSGFGKEPDSCGCEWRNYQYGNQRCTRLDNRNFVTRTEPDEGDLQYLHSLRHGGQMGWLIDPEECVVLVYRPNDLPDELIDDAQLPCLAGIDWGLTVAQLFSWLKVGGS